jgi:hypothetical protein
MNQELPMRLSGILLLASVLTLAACASSGPTKGTQLQSSWSDPSVTLTPGKKVLVVFRDKDTAKRREVETEMAALVKGAVLGVDVLPEREMLTNSEATRFQLKRNAIDYVLVLHFDGLTPQLDYKAADVYRQQSDTGLYGYWDNGWKAAYEGESITKTNKVIAQADTRVFDVATGKLVWSSKSQSFNPQSSQAAIREILKANADGLRKSGLIR